MSFRKERKDLELARELRKLRNMRVMVITIVINTFRTVPKCLERGRKSWRSEDVSRLRYCLDRPEYSEVSKRSVETCCHLDSSERTPVNSDMKNSHIIIIIIIITTTIVKSCRLYRFTWLSFFLSFFLSFSLFFSHNLSICIDYHSW